MVDGAWKICKGTDLRHEPDSLIHRYDREVGFAISDEELAMVGRNQIAAAAERSARCRNKQDSHMQTVKRWALLERYLQAFHPDEDYTIYLRKLGADATPRSEDAEMLEDAPERCPFRACPALLRLAYTEYLRRADPASAKPDRKSSTIRKYVITATASVLIEFSQPKQEDKRVKDTVAGYTDGEESAEAFDVEQTMPKLWTALWALRGWGMMKRIMAWAMLLVAMSIMARASCLTTYCPMLEDTELPPPRHWDRDGLPKYITIGMRNWKSRLKTNRGKLYKMKIRRNYLDATYCPVLWTLIYLKYSGHETGALFQMPGGRRKGERVTDTCWCGMTNHWFEKVGIRVGGHAASRDPDTDEYISARGARGATNHSIRRSAAQWAGRCGAREMDVRNAGRWRSMQILAKYLGQGAMEREAYEDDEEGPCQDPIFRMWVFKRVTAASDAGLDIM